MTQPLLELRNIETYYGPIMATGVLLLVMLALAMVR